MQHGMVDGGMPPFAAALLYIVFGLVVIGVILMLNQQAKQSGGHDHE